MQNAAVPASVIEPAATAETAMQPPAVLVEPEGAPTRVLWSQDLANIGQMLQSKFTKYKSDRRIAEIKWLRNQRQYLGLYDPEVDIPKNRSQAYPRLTRVKTISTLSRIMNLMFPGNDRNWDLTASPNAEMDPEDVQAALSAYLDQKAQAGLIDQSGGDGPQITDEDVQAAVQELANTRAKELRTLIDDQLQELGGDQTYDYIQLNRRMLLSGLMYGVGLLVGPNVRTVQRTRWQIGESGMPEPVNYTEYKPMFEFLPVWDFFPDMAAKTLSQMDGWFQRVVMSRNQIVKLKERQDFFPNVIDAYLRNNTQGNYKPLTHETELRIMGVKQMVNDQSPDGSKYEVLRWNGMVAGTTLRDIGVEVDEAALGEDIEAEIWMIDNYIIKAAINPWRKLGKDVRTLHWFLFDEDDTSPLANGLPNVIRDSQMTICAATRMMIDNASVVCAPNLEVNRRLLQPDQDLATIQPWKVWYRTDDDPMTVQWPAVREISFNSHINELMEIIKLFMEFADAETFVGPATGGDMAKAPSEPMRTAAGASMLKSDAALPFKDVIRNFDTTTQSLIYALVQFNSVFNPSKAAAGDYDVVARGATSLISKEVRGMQMDVLATTLSDSDKVYIDEEALLKERLATRDAENVMLPPSKARIKKQQVEQAQQAQQQLVQKQAEATIREALSQSYKNITQGQKNAAATQAEGVKSALALLEAALNGGGDGADGSSKGKASEAGGGPSE